MTEDNVQTEEYSQPLCPQCLTPFEPLQHYCANCGGTVGDYTRYMPFVNIPFQVEFFGKVWKLFWNGNISFFKKIGIFPILISLWGSLFWVGVPFEIWKKYKKRKHNPPFNK